MPIPTFREKEYQQRALDRFDAFVAALLPEREKYEKALELLSQNPGIEIQLKDFASAAWKKLTDAGMTGRMREYSPRETGDKKPVPNCTLKLPTAGGKTFLAAACAARLVSHYLPEGERGFVLWIVPSEAIYSQTKAQLSDREHPYRQLLDRVSGGRVKLLEKNSPLNADDVVANLCVMLLMLPSANRETKETLELFRDRGDVNGFFPPDDDQPAHSKLVREIPNLNFVPQAEMFGEDAVGMIRSSLGNALRIIRPIIVMDEGQKAFSRLAYETLYGFNPRFVIELSATPKDSDERWSNWLTNISGVDLEAEEMIKMPIVLDARDTTDWRDCLRRAWEQTQDLMVRAEKYREDVPRYIRPILLVQVEATGKEQADKGLVHANHAREFLISLGVSPDAVRLKTATENEIEGVDLLAENCPVRAIITKSALQEGWDCSFAYVLCSLTPARSLSGMTQMLGRILRQPEASKTRVRDLDQCYVFTSFAQTREVFSAVKDGLEREGMGDLAGRVKLKDRREETDLKPRLRIDAYRGVEFYLPQVLYVDGKSMRALDWEADILGNVDWRSLSIAENMRGLPKTLDSGHASKVIIDLNILKGEGRRVVEQGVVGGGEFDLTYAVRAMATEIPNPFVAARVITECLDVLRGEGWTEDEFGLQQRYLTGAMLTFAREKVDVACKAVFDKGLAAHHIRFNLRTAFESWKVPDEQPRVQQSNIKARRDGEQFELSLFQPVYDYELNGFEYEVASYIDETKAIDWWYRNVARGDGYGLQGWRKNKMYPDFILARRRDASHAWVVLETKGVQLAGNDDTNYKIELVEKLVKAFEAQKDLPPVGELELIEGDHEFACRLLMQTGWESELAGVLG